MKSYLSAMAGFAWLVSLPNAAFAMTYDIYPAGERYRDCAVQHLSSRPSAIQSLMVQLDEREPVLRQAWSDAFREMVAHCGRVPTKPLWSGCVGSDGSGLPDALRVAQLLLVWSDHVQRVAGRATWVKVPVLPRSTLGER